MSPSEEDSFTKKFALYLAVGLLGPNKVIEYLNGDERKEQLSIPLYWRSKLMIPGISRMLSNVGGTKDSTSVAFPLTKLLFFDVTFTFDKNTEHGKAKDSKNDVLATQGPASPRILVSFGFFLLLQKGPEAACRDERVAEFGGGHYISTEPLDYEQIVSYMNSLQLDRDSVSPEKLANSIAEEFLRQRTPSDTTDLKEAGSVSRSDERRRDETHALTVDYVHREDEKQEVKSTTPHPDQSQQSLHDSSSICVTIPCKSMGDSNGKLVLKRSSSGVTKFDMSAMRFLYWDFSKNPNHFENASKNMESFLAEKDLVDEAFDRWQMQIKMSVNDKNGDKSSGNQNSTRPAESTANVESNGTRNNGRPKKRKRSKEMGILPSARRRRNKGLVYDST